VTAVAMTSCAVAPPAPQALEEFPMGDHLPTARQQQRKQLQGPALDVHHEPADGGFLLRLVEPDGSKLVPVERGHAATPPAPARARSPATTCGRCETPVRQGRAGEYTASVATVCRATTAPDGEIRSSSDSGSVLARSLLVYFPGSRHVSHRCPPGGR
jgi:hypothetical protein